MKGQTYMTQGYVWNKEELQEIFSSSYLLILPSLWPQTMNYSVIEAMANDKIVVAYDVWANNGAIVHGENGLLAELGNMEQFCISFSQTIKGRKARKRASEMFALDRMVNN
jgi:glycosyltransferase involved in cell wall biosynthesis